MAGPIELSIVTPERRILSERVDEVRAPSAEGLFGVLPGHTAFLTRSEPGELSFRSGGSSTSFAIGGGFIQVEDDKVTVLTETAESAATIDLERARRAQADAQAKMKGLGVEDPVYVRELARAKRAAARIAVASR